MRVHGLLSLLNKIIVDRVHGSNKINKRRGRKVVLGCSRPDVGRSAQVTTLADINVVALEDVGWCGKQEGTHVLASCN